MSGNRKGYTSIRHNIETTYLILCTAKTALTCQSMVIMTLVLSCGVWHGDLFCGSFGLRGSDLFQRIPKTLDRIGIWGIWGPSRCLELMVASSSCFEGLHLLYNRVWMGGGCMSFTCMPIVNQILVSHSGHINLIIGF